MSRLPRAAHAAALALWLAASPARAAGAECVVPARPGGGADLTCRLLQAGLVAPVSTEPVRIVFRPGAGGALAFEAAVGREAGDGDTLVAFSSGSLLNLALGKFGGHSDGDVRWVAAFAADFGVIAVRGDAPWRTLGELAAALRADPQRVAFGISGTVGGQDWMKAALFARAVGVDPRALRFASFEGGGEAFAALGARRVQVVTGDLAEASTVRVRGGVRVLAVLADARVPGHDGIPTAHEQGVPLTWPSFRGVYVGPKVPDADYHRWVTTFQAMLWSPQFARARERLGLLPYALIGAPLRDQVAADVQRYATLARGLGLRAAR